MSWGIPAQEFLNLSAARSCHRRDLTRASPYAGGNESVGKESA